MNNKFFLATERYVLDGRPTRPTYLDLAKGGEGLLVVEAELLSPTSTLNQLLIKATPNIKLI